MNFQDNFPIKNDDNATRSRQEETFAFQFFFPSFSRFVRRILSAKSNRQKVRKKTNETVKFTKLRCTTSHVNKELKTNKTSMTGWQREGEKGKGEKQLWHFPTNLNFQRLCNAVNKKQTTRKPR